MAMDKASMANRIKMHLAAVGNPSEFGTPVAYADACRVAMCQGIIEEIQANAVVNVESVSGVVAGGAASGPGLGTVS